MEARGFEPRSEIGSTTASTCVAHHSGSPETGRQAADSRTSLLESRPSPEGAAAGQPDFAIPTKPPQAGFLAGRCGNAKRYAASARLLLAVVIFPRDSPGLRTWARSHSFTDPVEAKSPPNGIGARKLEEETARVNRSLDKKQVEVALVSRLCDNYLHAAVCERQKERLERRCPEPRIALAAPMAPRAPDAHCTDPARKKLPRAPTMSPECRTSLFSPLGVSCGKEPASC